MAKGKEVQSTDKQEGVLCHICDANKPSIFCNLCKQSMCDYCKKRHDQVRSFETHSITPLCQNHGQPLTYICHTCISGMCIKCVLNDHINHDHGKEFDTFSEGVENLRMKSKELNQNVKEGERKLHEKLSNVEAKLEQSRTFKASLKKLRAEYVDKISKIDNVLNDMEENHEAKGEEFRLELTKLLGQCEKLTNSLDVDGKGDQQVTDEYKLNDNLAQEILQKSMEILSENFPEIEYEHLGEDFSVCIREVGLAPCSVDIINKVPKEVLRYEGVGKIKRPIHVVAASADSAIVSDEGLARLFHIHKDGLLIKSYTELVQSMGDVRAAAVQGGHCYTLQDRSLTKFCLDDPQDGSSVKPGLDNMMGICPVGQDDFIITSASTNNRAVYQFSFETCKKKEVLNLRGEGDKPWFITRTSNSTYLVSFPWARCVKEYDEKWTLLHTITKCGTENFGSPLGIAATPFGHILIADFCKNRITCYNRDGTFNKHILTAADGIERPVGLAFRSPYLWVAQADCDIPCLKCFEFC